MPVQRDELKLVVLIIAHKNIGQLLRLISAISHPQVIIYIHIDKKSDLDGSMFPDHVRIVKNSVAVTWKLYSQVTAIINSMNEVVRNEVNFDYLTLISGQDYPIRSMETILDSLAEQAGTEFIHHVPLDQTGWNQARIRFERFYFQSYPGPLIRFGGRLITFVCDKVRWKRRFYKGLRPWGGSAWWTLTRPCILYILNLVEKDKGLVSYMMKTIHADEIIFQTIVMNSPFAEKAVSKNFRYMEWVRGNPNPNILTRLDFLKIVESPHHFARKFDQEIDEEIMDILDDYRNRIL
jgi:hypothetical protein